MVPFQTFVVGSTIFLTKENWNSFFRTSIHNILEPEAFFAISDGCDDFSFLLKGPVPDSQKGVYDKVYSEARYDHNQPFPGFYDALINQMKELISINNIINTKSEVKISRLLFVSGAGMLFLIFALFFNELLFLFGLIFLLIIPISLFFLNFLEDFLLTFNFLEFNVVLA